MTPFEAGLFGLFIGYILFYEDDGIDRTDYDC